jgi:hypothetical protein
VAGFAAGPGVAPSKPAGDDIVGTRTYGKGTENDPDPRVYRYPQKRLAYCAIREWAIKKGYVDLSDPSTINECPRPASGSSAKG